ncbi:hypothetical protein [Trinickia soli]|uniref:hypothetical protein n=1 Tax=Trinickia soli TaxID=380675 RepID=UPI003FA389B9
MSELLCRAAEKVQRCRFNDGAMTAVDAALVTKRKRCDENNFAPCGLCRVFEEKVRYPVASIGDATLRIDRAHIK